MNIFLNILYFFVVVLLSSSNSCSDFIENLKKQTSFIKHIKRLTTDIERLNKISKIKEHIIEIDLLNSKHRICATLLETELRVMKDVINNQLQTLKYPTGNTTNALEDLNDQVGKLLRNLTIFIQKYNPKVVVESIKEHKFEEAETILESMEFDSILPFIVIKVYAGSINNLEVLLNFTKSLNSIRRSLNTLIILWEEVESLQHLNIDRTIKIINVFESEILHQPLFNEKLYPEANIFGEILVEMLTKFVSNKLESAMLSNTFASDYHIKRLLIKIYNFKYSFTIEVICFIIDNLYNRMSRLKIVDNIFIQSKIAIIEDVFIYMYEKMIKFKDQNDSTILRIAQYLLAIEGVEYSSIGVYGRRHNDLNSILP